MVRITETLTKMLISFRDRPTDPAAVVSVYVDALGSLGEENIRRVAGRFMRGIVDGHNMAFAPSTAEFAAEAERLRDEDRRYEAVGPRREPLKPVRMPWQKHPSWETITRPPPGGWVPDPDEAA